MFRRMAGNPTGGGFPHGALEFLPGITRGLLRKVNQLPLAIHS